MKPLLLLDIDGVVNAGRRKPIEIWPGDDQWISEEVENSTGVWPVTVAKPVLEFITKIHAEGLAEIRWHTTWQEEALDFADTFGLPTFHIQPCPEATKNGTMYWWKLPCVQRELSVGRKVLWIDDDIERNITSVTRRLLTAGGDLKLVIPKTATGLSPENTIEVLRFLEGKDDVR